MKRIKHIGILLLALVVAFQFMGFSGNEIYATVDNTNPVQIIDSEMDPDIYFPILYADYVEEPLEEMLSTLSSRAVELPVYPPFYTSARDVVLVLDISGSMAGNPLTQLKRAALRFCQSALSISSNVRIAIISYASSATLIQNFTDNFTSLSKTIDGLSANGSTNIAGALLLANDLLNYHGRNASAKTIILMTDGAPNINTYTGANPKYSTTEYGSGAPYASFVYNTAQTMQHHEIITLGFFHSLSGDNLKLGRQLLLDIQNRGYHDVIDGNNLDIAFDLIRGDIWGEKQGPGGDRYEVPGEGETNNNEINQMIGDPVNVVNGNLTWDYTDFELYGAQRLSFLRHYNSISEEETTMGYGWRHSFSYNLDFISKIYEDEDIVIASVTLQNGYINEFLEDADGGYTALQPNIALRKTESGYIFTNYDETRVVFDSDGKALEIYDVNENRTVLQYVNGLLSRAENRAGSMSFWHTDGKLSSITDHTGRTVYYKYDEAGNLTKFINADGDSLDYVYDANHNLIEVSDFNGNTYMKNTYVNNKVTAQYLADQGTSYFEYYPENRRSVCTNPVGLRTVYFYDENYRITYTVEQDSDYSDEYEEIENENIVPMGFMEAMEVYEGALNSEATKANETALYSEATEARETIEDSGIIGEGTITSPFILSDAEQISLISSAMSLGDNVKGVTATEAHYKLDGNIDMSMKTNFFGLGTSLYRFRGSFDGGGYEIKLAINSTVEDYVGLFRYTEDAVLKNISTTGTVRGRNYVGSLVGRASGGTKIENCTNRAAVTGNSYVGGLACAAFEDTEFIGCNNTGTVISGNNYAGGIVSYSENAKLNNCTNAGNVSGTARVGGIAGDINGGMISEAENTGSIRATAASSYVSGIAGYVTAAIISDSKTFGNISGLRYIGGIAGYCTIGTIISSNTSHGDITGTSETGGIAGYATGTTINDCISHGNTRGTIDTGGIAGVFNSSNVNSPGRIEGCSTNGNIMANTATNNRVGGIAGSVTTSSTGTITIQSTYYNGEVVRNDGTGTVGLFVGAASNAFVIENCGYYVKGVAEPAEATLLFNGLPYDESLIERESNGSFVMKIPVSKTAGNTAVVNNMPDSISFTYPGYQTVTVFLSENNAKIRFCLMTLNSNYDAEPSITGEGTVTSPFILTNADQLFLVASRMSIGGEIKSVPAAEAFYKLGGSIDMSTKTNFFGMGSSLYKFRGCFDGDGYEIKFAIDSTVEDYVGLFRYTDGAVLRNITITGTVRGRNYVSSLIGSASNATKIDNCVNRAAITGNSYVGGLTGAAYESTEFTGCSNTGTVTVTATSSNNCAGGISGYVENAKLNKCKNAGNVSGSDRVGGIVGNINGGEISEAENRGDIRATATSSYISGIAGYATGAMINDSNTYGYISGVNYVGGIIGYAATGTTISGSETYGIATGSRYTGGITGYATGTTISKSVSHESVTGTSETGGIAGYAAGTLIVDCVSHGNARGTTDVGGIAGIFNSSSSGLPGRIEGCAADGSIIANTATNNRAGGIAGSITTSSTGTITISGTYFEGKAVRNDNTGTVGLFVGTAPNASVIENSGYYIKGSVEPASAMLFFNEIPYDESLIERGGNGSFSMKIPVNKATGSTVVVNNTPDSISLTAPRYQTVRTFLSEDNNKIRYNIAIPRVVLKSDDIGIMGGGTSTSPFILVNSEQLLHVVSAINLGVKVNDVIATEAYYKLGDDIDLSGETHFYGMGSSTNRFKGGFDGGGYEIKLDIFSTIEDYVGLFRYTDGAVLKNLTLIGSVRGRNCVGSIAARASGGTKIENCVNRATITGNSYVGGIAGAAYEDTEFTSSNNEGAVTLTSNSNYAGGIASYSESAKLNSCINEGTITGGSYTYIGGLLGMATGVTEIKNSSNKANVNGGARVGGIVGELNGGAVTGAENTGDIRASASSSYVSGIAGYSTGTTIRDSETQGNISGSNYVGGIVGYSAAGTTVSSDETYGNITGSRYVGGIIGYAAGTTISNSASHESVTGTSDVGGITGYFINSGRIEDCTVNGNVIANTNSNNLVGGVVGTGNGAGTIFNTYFNGGTIRNSGTGTVGVYIGTAPSNLVIENSGYYIKGAVEPSGATLFFNEAAYDESQIERGFNGSFTMTIPVSKTTGSTVAVNNAPDSISLTYPGYRTVRIFLSEDNNKIRYSIMLPRVVLDSSYDIELSIDGEGVVTSPFILTSAEQLLHVVSAINLNGEIKSVTAVEAYYKLGDNIDLSGETHFYGMGSSSNMFKGGFDGVDYEIKLEIYSTVEDYVGFFRYTDGALLKNITISGSIRGRNRVGSVVARASGSTKIENCVNRAIVTGNSYVGGLAGTASEGTELTSCNNEGTVTLTSNSNYAGGIVSYSDNAKLYGCINEGTVSGGSYTYIGGLIGIATGVTEIRNGSNKANVSGGARVGGVVGEINGGAISEAENTGDIRATATSSYVAGLAGYATGATISNSETSGNISGSRYSGGIAGYANGTTVSRSVFHGSVSGTSDIGGITGYFINNGRIDGCIADGNVMASTNSANLVGGIVGTGSGAGTISYTYYDGGTIRNSGSGTVGIFIGTAPSNLVIENSGYYIKGSVEPADAMLFFNEISFDESLVDRGSNGSFVMKILVSKATGSTTALNNSPDSISLSYPEYRTVNVFLSENNDKIRYNIAISRVILNSSDNIVPTIAGEGTATSPFIITDSEQLFFVASEMNVGGKLKDVATAEAYYRLDDNIDLSGKAYFFGIGSSANMFKGSFDGGGHEIKLDIYSTIEDYVGLFRYTDGAVLKNLEITGNVRGRNFVGGIAGRASNAKIENCVNRAAVIGSRVGGLAGITYEGVEFVNCKNFGTVTSSNNWAGGLVGYSENLKLDNCVNEGTVVGGSYSYIGGLLGATTGVTEIRNSNNKANVSGGARVGGIVGEINGGAIGEAENTGDIRATATSSYVSGIAGYATGAMISDSETYGNISGLRYAGGVTGYATGAIIESSVSHGNISGTSDVGGITGYFTGNSRVEDCFAYGNVIANTSSNNLVGGIVGTGNGAGTISNTYFDGETVRNSGAGTVGVFIGTAPSALVIENSGYYVKGEVEPAAAMLFLNGAPHDESFIDRGSNGSFIMEIPVSKGTGSTVAANNTPDYIALTHSGYKTASIFLSENNVKTNYSIKIPNIALDSSEDLESGITGEGTISLPFVLTDTEQLLLIVSEMSVGGKIKGATASEAYYKLGGDIDLSGEANFLGMGSSFHKFRGGFDGGGYEIKLEIYGTVEDYVGLFRYTDGAVLKNITTTGSVRGRYYVGSLVGSATSGTVFENCVNRATIAGSSYVGGLTGLAYENTEFTACSNTGAVTSSSNYVGGLVSYSENTKFSNCENSGNISGSGYVGGIIGYSNTGTTIAGCASHGDIGGTGETGGITGYATGTIISGSISNGNVSGNSNVGGITGLFNSTNINLPGRIEDCTANVRITANTSTSNRAGGIAGYITSSSTGTISILNTYFNGDAISNNSSGTVGIFVGAVSNALVIENSGFYIKGVIEPVRASISFNGESYDESLIDRGSDGSFSMKIPVSKASGNNPVINNTAESVSFEFDGYQWERVVLSDLNAKVRYTLNISKLVLMPDDIVIMPGDISRSQIFKDGQLISSSDYLGYTTLYEYDSFGNQQKITYPDDTEELFEYNDKRQVTKSVACDGSVTLYEYDKRGNLILMTDALGYSQNFQYDDDNNLIQYTDANNAKIGYTYDSMGNRTSAIDALGNKTTFEYDVFGRLSTITSPKGEMTKYEYSPAGKLLKITDTEGNEKYYEVNGNGYNTEVTDFGGNTVKTAYDKMNNPISITDAIGNTVNYKYDEAGNMVETVDALGNTVFYTYDYKGRLKSTKDPLGNEWNYKYNANGRLSQTIDPYGNTSTITYDNMDRITTTNNARKAETNFKYNDEGRVTYIKDALGSEKSAVYDYNGNLIKQTDKNGNRWEYKYDKENRLIKTNDPMGGETVYEYNELGQLVKTITPEGSAFNSIFDANGQLIRETDPLGNVFENIYDSLGRFIQRNNPDNTNVTFEYDKNGLLMKAIDENGYSTSYFYNKNGQVLSITDAIGSVTQFEYNANGQILSVTDVLDGVVLYEYDGNGNVLSVTDQLGSITAYKYDKLNRVSSVTDAIGGITVFEYDENSNIIKIKDAEDYITTFDYDLLDRLISYTEAEGNTFSIRYDKNGNITAKEDARGNDMYFNYDGLDRLKTVTDQAGGKIEYFYDKDGRTIKIVNQEGAETSYDYDLNGRIISAKDSLGNETQFEYDSMDRLVKTTNAKDTITGFEYTNTGLLQKITDAMGGIYSYEYDALGRLVSKTNQNIEKISYQYDALGRVLSVTNPLGFTDSFTYDAKGRITSVTDRNDAVTKYKYDENDNLIETTDALNNTSYFGYDKMNRLIKTTLYGMDDPDGQITIYEYDGRGLVTKVINALGDKKLNIYDENGNLISITDEDGYVIQYTYDARNLAQSITYSGGKKAEFTYNKVGQLVEFSDWTGKTSFTLDLLGRITAINDSNNKKATYGYDAVGNQTSIGYPDETTVSYSFDSLNRIASVTDSDGKSLTYKYDPTGMPIELSYPNSITEKYTYDKAGQLLKTIDGLNTLLYEYEYDPMGNIIYEYKKGENESIPKSANFEYNSLNQLKSKTMSGGGIFDFTYDKRGNLIKENDRVTNAVVKSYTYDDTNKMVSGMNEKGEISTYTYNCLGILTNNTKTTTDGIVSTDYVVDYTDPIQNYLMALEADGLEYRYIYGLSGRISANVINIPTSESLKLYIQNDKLGSGRFASDELGEVVGFTEMDVWGNVVENMVPAICERPINLISNFTNYDYDDVLGIYYAKARMYDPANRRFMSVDSVKGDVSNPQSLNAYVYVLNNSLKYVDQSGKMPTKEQINYMGTKWYEIVKDPYQYIKTNDYKSIVSDFIHLGEMGADIELGAYSYAVRKLGINKDFSIGTAEIGALFLNMDKDDGIYHAQFDCWQRFFGYNSFYDWVFSLGTSMERAYFPFYYCGEELIFWAWKGDYLNLGMGAELGIYKNLGIKTSEIIGLGEKGLGLDVWILNNIKGLGNEGLGLQDYNSPHWLVDRNLALPMSLKLRKNGILLIDYNPLQEQWWITAFDPSIKYDFLAEDLTVTYEIDFKGKEGMYNAFINSKIYPYYESDLPDVRGTWYKVPGEELKLQFTF